MYFYFYDKFTQDKQYQSTIAAIESRLIDLGINGRMEKLSIFKNATELISDAIKKGAQTVVAVGDDRTFSTVLNIVARFEGVTLGFIPLVPDAHFAQALGIPTGIEACNILSKRLYETYDLGHIQDHYFLGCLTASEPSRVQLRCDDKYTMSTTQATTDLRIMNLGDITNETPPRIAQAHDGRLDVVISPMMETGVLKKKKVRSAEQESVLYVQHISVESVGTSVQLTADDGAQFNTPCEVTVEPAALRIIVGRERMNDVTEATPAHEANY